MTLAYAGRRREILLDNDSRDDKVESPVLRSPFSLIYIDT
jgi:hypothetical protein